MASTARKQLCYGKSLEKHELDLIRQARRDVVWALNNGKIATPDEVGTWSECDILMVRRAIKTQFVEHHTEDGEWVIWLNSMTLGSDSRLVSLIHNRTCTDRLTSLRLCSERVAIQWLAQWKDTFIVGPYPVYLGAGIVGARVVHISTLGV